MISAPTASARPRQIAAWLSAVAALVVLMVVVGGITRLTESGLSMVRWEPVTGILPPLSQEAWQAEFADYQASPEYRNKNAGMSLGEYKNIYFWEWAHRVLGRLIGLAFAVPLIWFWVRGRIPAGYKPRLVALLALGGLQGVIGWWMVTSGLADVAEVSHLRLAVHLNLAFFIIAALIWTAGDLIRGRAKLTGLAVIAFAGLFIQTILGAFVAGMDAGHIYSEWPMMGGQFFPAYPEWIQPAWRNVVDNPVVVQWTHRWWAFIAAALLVWLSVSAMKRGSRKTPIMLKLLLVVQILLGIMTLMSGVELWIAATHQGVAALIFWCAAACAHRIGESKEPAA
ncbi:MAG: COX15/CtaA family protein [Pacificimonas sp.]